MNLGYNKSKIQAVKQTLNNLSKESIEEGTLKALKQIEEKRYSQELIHRGIKDIIKLAIVFKGKSVRIIQEENMGQ